MDKEKIISVVKDCAQLVDSLHVAGGDKQKCIMVAQALMQLVGDLIKEEDGQSNDKLPDPPFKPPFEA